MTRRRSWPKSGGARRPAVLVLAFVLAFTLVGCVPGAVPRRIAVSATDARIEVAPGETVDLVFSYHYDAFGLAPGDLDALDIVPDELQTARRAVTGRFTVRDAGVPVGWGLRKVRVDRVRDPLGTEPVPGFGGDAGDLYRIEAVVRVHVADGAPFGITTLRIVLRAFNGTEVARVVQADVRPAGSEATVRAR